MKDRFLAKVRKTKTCWIWEGCKTHSGHGQFRTIRNRRAYAHRVSYLLFKGVIPEDKFVLHSCNNPSCVNPDHLRLGSQVENMRDAVKAKTIKGQVLTSEDVVDIRKRFAEGEHPKSIAAVFGVSRTNIYNIISGYSWTHV